MKDIVKLLNNNRQWANRMMSENPNFFSKLKRQQRPKYLWIGCSDSRVPANQITGLLPGEVFVHRNISNQVINTDMNLMCVLQYAIEILRVRHIIVCGHYDCGGINAVMDHKISGLLEHWLENVKVLKSKQSAVTADQMSELNVMEQVKNLTNNTIVQKAWRQGRKLYIHGWIYSISNGLIKDLKVTSRGLSNQKQW
ncbi:MAG: carbonic anhydrase [Nitrospirae bacterium]|nr:carbonic anhydrase [Nitrospirota bacterium]